MSSALARLLAALDDDRPDAIAPKLDRFERVLVLVVGVEYWLRAIPKWGQLAPAYYVHLALATVLCSVVLLVRRGGVRRAALLALALSHAVLVWREFPSTGNHAYLEVVYLLLGATLRLDVEPERRLYLRAVRWTVLIVLFYSGLQKLMSGYWTNGQYLAFSLASDSYRSVLGWLLPADELARLSALRGDVGSGPYTPASTALLLVSNLTWMLEMTLGPLLVWRRTRRFAVVATLALIVGIELAAREAFFGLVFANALMLFWSGALGSWSIFAALFLLVLTLSRLGVLPEATFY